MLRMSGKLILNNISNINIDNSEIIDNGYIVRGANIIYSIDDRDDILLHRYLYALQDGYLYTYKLHGIKPFVGGDDIEVLYLEHNKQYSDTLIEKENLFNMMYGTDNGDGLTKEEIQELIINL
jgi:hypothetical protein